MVMIRKSGISLLLIYTLLVTILRSLRTPNDFAAVHWLLDYRFGFVKRGLVGELLSLAMGILSMPVTEKMILILSGAAFAAFCVVMVILSLQIIQHFNGSAGAVLVTLAFLSSAFMVMSAHLFGYFDNIVIMLGIMSIILLLKGNAWSGAVLQMLGLFIHENSLFLSFVPFCLAWFLMNAGRKKSAVTFLPLLLPMGVFFLIVIGMEFLVREDFIVLFSARLSQFPFITEYARENAPLWVSTSMSKYYETQSVDIFRRMNSIVIYIFFLPSAFVTLFFTLNAFSVPAKRWIINWVLIGSCLVPQLMHLVAWDTFRIWTYTIFCAFIALWVYTKLYPPQRDPFANGLIPLIILLVNAMLAVPLMDGETERFSLGIRLLSYLPVFAGGLLLVLKQRQENHFFS